MTVGSRQRPVPIGYRLRATHVLPSKGHTMFRAGDVDGGHRVADDREGEEVTLKPVKVWRGEKFCR